ncbi:MAG: hypothetical protein WCK05_11160 [Planctomycetota bacterium]
MNSQTRGFTDACHGQPLAELRTALAGPADEVDCRTWGISAEEWRTAIETAIEERTGAARLLGARGGAARTAAQAAAGRRNGAKGGRPTTYQLTSCKGAWTVTGTIAEARAKARELQSEYQAAYGTAVTRPDGRVVYTAE